MNAVIICQICGKHFRFISNTHLAKHGLTIAEYQAIYGATRSAEYLAAMSQGQKGRIHESRYDCIDWPSMPLGQKSDAALALELGIPRQVIQRRREKMGIAACDRTPEVVFLFCKCCGKEFEVAKKYQARRPRTFCSRKCKSDSLKGQVRPELRVVHPDNEKQIVEMYLSGLSTKVIAAHLGCTGETVRRTLSLIGVQRRSYSEITRGIVRSQETRAKISRNHANVSGTRNPMYGRSPGHGKAIFVPHLNKKVRSTWEYHIANILLELGITHEYETRRIHLNDFTYVPDFYLPDYDLHLEVKGWKNERFHRVMEALEKERPDIQLLIIDADIYRKIRADSLHLLDIIGKPIHSGKPHAAP